MYFCFSCSGTCKFSRHDAFTVINPLRKSLGYSGLLNEGGLCSRGSPVVMFIMSECFISTLGVVSCVFSWLAYILFWWFKSETVFKSLVSSYFVTFTCGFLAGSLEGVRVFFFFIFLATDKTLGRGGKVGFD